MRRWLSEAEIRSEVGFMDSLARIEAEQAIKTAHGFVNVPESARTWAEWFRQLWQSWGYTGQEQRSPYSLDVVLERVAKAQDDAMLWNMRGGAHTLPYTGRERRERFQVRVEWDTFDLERVEELSWVSFVFGMRVGFLTALRVSGDLSKHFKDEPGIRVVLLEEEDGTQLLRNVKDHGVAVYAPREVLVWRGGEMDMSWRPVPGRKATALKRRAAGL